MAYVKVNDEKPYYRDFEELYELEKDHQKLNIAMFTNNYFPFIGGVPISIKRLIDALTKRGHHVFLFAPKYPNHKEKNKTVFRCKLICFYRSKGFDYAITNIFSSSINKEFVKHHFDVVHVHHPFWMGTKGLRLAKKNKIPVIYTYHTRLEKYAHYLPFLKKTFQNILSHHLIKRFSQKCDAIIAPTTTAKEYLENIGVSKEKFIIPTGVCLEQYNNDIKHNTEQKELILCSVSRLSEEKNISFLLEGIRYIKEQSNLPFKVNLIGSGPEEKNIKAFVKKYNLTNTIQLIGSVPPEVISQHYIESDLFIFSSQSETQGMVILEAMAGGCPVVAIRSSGIDDVIINDYNGYKTKANIKSFANRIIALMDDDEKRSEMKENALKFSKDNSVDMMAKKVEEIYYKKISQKKVLIKYLSKKQSKILSLLKEHYD